MPPTTGTLVSTKGGDFRDLNAEERDSTSRRTTKRRTQTHDVKHVSKTLVLFLGTTVFSFWIIDTIEDVTFVQKRIFFFFWFTGWSKSRCVVRS